MIKSAIYLIFFISYSTMAAKPICQNIENNPIYDQILAEVKSCNPHSIHITFDDGPNLNTTAAILDKLKMRNVNATFFVSTANLHGPSESLNIKLRELVNRELSEGNTVGDHGDQHKPYDLRMLQGVVLENGFTATEADTEIRRSIELLDNATGEQFSKQKNLLFRFPYGRGAIPSPEELDHMEHDKIHPFRFRSQNFNDRLLQYKKQNSAVASIAGFGFSHIGWNHDSLDTDGRTVSLKDYVKGNIQRFCESKEKIQVALFHDIKAINAEAIPLIIDIGKCLGLDFVSTEKMIQESKYLTTKGVLIPKDFQLKGVVHEATHIGDVINKTPGPTCQLQEAVEKTPCVSSNGSTYQHCTGDEYICINGSWIIKAQVLLDGLCR